MCHACLSQYGVCLLHNTFNLLLLRCGMLCRVAILEEELGRMNPDMSAIAAFQAKEAEYAQRVSDLEAATAERDNVSYKLNLPCYDCLVCL